MGDKVYIGDSVYAEFDFIIAGDFVLTTENGNGANNTIYLEPQVIKTLLMVLAARKESNDVERQVNQGLIEAFRGDPRYQPQTRHRKETK